MAAFMVGKSLKDRRQHKAIEELFDKADKNGNGRISVQEYVNIFAEHGIEVGGEEVEKLGALANDDGEVTKGEFMEYAKGSDFFRYDCQRKKALLYLFHKGKAVKGKSHAFSSEKSH